jgi:hypothetical protein
VSRHRLSTKIVLSLAALGTTAAIAGLGTFATFTSSTSAGQSVAAGTVTIALGATGAATNRLTVSATNIVPGDTMQRSFDVSNTGTVTLASITTTTTATPSNVLTTDTTNGLQMVVDRCSTAWTEAGTSPAFTYTCGGTLTTIIASRPVLGNNLAMPGLSALTNGGTDHLRVTLTFPTTADNTFQGLTTTVTYSLTGTQRTATSK